MLHDSQGDLFGMLPFQITDQVVPCCYLFIRDGQLIFPVLLVTPLS